MIAVHMSPQLIHQPCPFCFHLFLIQIRRQRYTKFLTFANFVDIFVPFSIFFLLSHSFCSRPAFPLSSFVSPEFYSGFLSYVHFTGILCRLSLPAAFLPSRFFVHFSRIIVRTRSSWQLRREKRRARVSSHPKCLHIGIILIVYVIQKVVQRYCFFMKYANILINNFDISAFFCNFACKWTHNLANIELCGCWF